MRAVIVAGGTPPAADLLRRHCSESDIAIAADRGVGAFLSAGLTPDLIVGDLDSAAPPLVQEALKAGAALEQAPREKDETDLELAARAVVRLGMDEVILLGAGGGRTDHLLGNLAVVRWLSSQGLHVILEDDTQTVTVVERDMHFTVKAGDSFSIVPAGTAATVTATGLRYPLERLTLRNDSARGVSNVCVQDTVTLHTEGAVLVIHSPALGAKPS